MTKTSGPELRPSSLPETPYVGLVPYREEDSGLFFGRDDERKIVTANLRSSRLTILYGPSGVGKTSLLQAGVVHDLREEARADQHTPAEHVSIGICLFRDWREDPLPALMTAMHEAAREALGHHNGAASWRPGTSVVEALSSWTPDLHSLLVVLDQFEDYFLYHGDERGDDSVAGALPAIVNEPNLGVNVLLSIREDAWAKLDLFEGRIPRLFGNYLRVEHLNQAGAREAIERPVEEWNKRLAPGEHRYTLEPDLVDAVLDAAASGLALTHDSRGGNPNAVSTEEIEAPYLQLVMDRLWRETLSASSRELTVVRLEELGGPQQIVENHLLEALGALTPDEQAVAADAFVFLVTRSKTKVAHSASDLAEWTKRPEHEVSAVLEKLCRGENGRILRAVGPAGGAGETRYELFHDLLAEPVLDWRRGYAEDRARRAAYRKFARIGAVLTALIAVFAVLGIWALIQRSDAKRATRSATSLALASAAKDEVKRHVDMALLLGLAAYRVSRSAEATSGMVAALEAARRSGAEAILRGDTKGIRAIAFSPDGHEFASADFNGVIDLWDTRERVRLGELRGHTAEIWSLAFSPDGRTLASASHDGTVRLWDVSSRTSLGRLPVERAGVITSIAFSPDGRIVAFGGQGGRLQLWDIRARKPLGGPLHGHTDRVVSIAFSPDGKTLASAGFDHTVRLWDVATRKPLGRPMEGHKSEVASVAFSPDGHTLASSGLDGTVRFWDVRHRTALGPPLRAGSGEIWSVAFSPDGRTLASSGFDGTVRLWNTRTRKPAGRPLIGHTAGVVAVAFDPDGNTLASAAYDGTVRIWDLRRHGLGEPIGRHTNRVTDVVFDPDGQTLASVGFDGALRLWNVREHRALGRLGGKDAGSFEGVAVSPDGGTFATAGDDGTIELFDAHSRKLRARLTGHKGAVQSVAFDPDGHTLASAGDDGRVRLWNSRDGTPLGEPFSGTGGTIRSVTFSPDGHTLASAGDDGSLRLWDVRSHKLDARLPLGDTSALTVAFSPDGHTLATGNVDGTVRLWDARSLEPLGEPLAGHQDRVESVAFSPNGNVLASASDDGSVRLWDVRGHRALGAPLREHEGAVTSVAFSPDGRTLASGGADRTVRLWEGILWSDPTDLRSQVCRLVVGNPTKTEWGELAPGLAYSAPCPT